jgi:FkbM family methyltransferase
MYYSQHGEDYILSKVFKENEGFFVEVGCVDGLRFSNTLFFEEKGWTGLNIEAHNDYIEKLTKNRPNSRVVHAAVSDVDGGQVSFYANSRGSLSTLFKRRESFLERDYGDFFDGFTEQNVPRRTLNSILEENNVHNIDFISIDIEGGEKKALKGMDLNVYRPKVFVIESGTIWDLIYLRSFFKKYHYSMSLLISNNVFFTADPKLFKDVEGKIYKDIEIIHKGNSLLDEEDTVVRVDIDLRKRSFYKEIYSLMIHSIKQGVKNILKL